MKRLLMMNWIKTLSCAALLCAAAPISLAAEVQVDASPVGSSDSAPVTATPISVPPATPCLPLDSSLCGTGDDVPPVVSNGSGPPIAGAPHASVPTIPLPKDGSSSSAAQ